jgi:hypothetical protein
MVGDHDDLDQFDAEAGQLLAQPGSVLVPDRRRQHLGAGDQDAGPDYVFGGPCSRRRADSVCEAHSQTGT